MARPGHEAAATAAELTATAMLRTLGANIFLVLAYTVLMLAAEHLPPNYASAATFLVPQIGFAAVAWAFVPDRKRP